MKCPSCGAEIGSNKTCAYCGTQISVEDLRSQEIMNMAGCPKCGSTNIQINREKQGEIKGKKGTTVVRNTVAVCKDCGHTWYPVEPQKKRKTWLWVLGWIFIFPLPLTLIIVKKKNLHPALRYGIIAVAWIVYLLIGFSQSGKTQSVEQKQQGNSSTTIATSAEAEKLNVSIDVAADWKDDAVVFSLDTNLPDETSLILTLTNGDFNTEEHYMAQSKVTITNGHATSSGFSINNEKLSGNYDLSISMSLPSLQSEKVREVIGESGEHMQGSLVIPSGYSNSQVIKAYYAVMINDSVVVNPETTYSNTVFREESSNS